LLKQPLTGKGWKIILIRIYYKVERRKVMKLNIKIDDNFEEPETLITTSKMTDEVNKVVDFISKLGNVATVITGIKGDKVELLEQEFLVRIYTEDGKVFARTENDLYLLRLRLYELEERLDSTIFVRISNSEIVNLKKVKSLDLSFVGTICMGLANGEVSYVSRRYVSKIKKLLGL
jgi:DNA-binding LytR/AlgR family response regulator